MKKLQITTLGLSLLSLTAFAPTAKADFIGIYAGIGQANLDYSGGISQGSERIDLASDLGFGEEGQVSYYAAFEHPLPFFPNVKVQRQDLEQVAVNTLDRNINYAGNVFSANAELTTTLDLGHTDFIVYYEILDNWVSVDVGLNFKYFDGFIGLDASTNTITNAVSNDLDDFLPMLYGRAQFAFPTTNFSVDLETSVLLAGGDGLTDIKAALAYESDLGFGAEIGIKRITLEIDDLGDVFTEMTFEGYFVNATFHF